MTIDLGFTGTQIGMTVAQARQVARLLDAIKYGAPRTEDDDLEEIRGHHGCCPGSDLEFGQMCRDRGFPVEAHPGPDGIQPGSEELYDVIHPAIKHLARNREIVLVADAVIATPPTALPQARGGTWYTIRHARKVGVPTLVVFPDGTFNATLWTLPLFEDKS